MRNDLASTRIMLRVALGMLLATIAAGSLSYSIVEGWSLFDGLYMVVITLSTVGYGEVNPLSASGKLITMAVIGFGLAALTLCGAGVTRLILEGELREVLGKRKMERNIGKLRDHYIVCGYGRVGRVVCGKLAAEGVPFVIVDNSERMQERIEADGFLTSPGDATEEETLHRAGLAGARGILLTLPSEADNVYVTLLAKDLRPDVFVLARAISDQGDRRLKAAGADRVVSPNIIGGYRMAHAALHPNVVEFIDVVSGDAEMKEFEVKEVRISEGSPCAGKTIGEMDIRRHFELVVVGRVDDNGVLAFNPALTDTVDPGVMLIVLGRRADLERFSASMSA